MPSSILFTALVAILSLLFENATPARARLLSRRIQNSYIVKLKAGTNITNHIDSLPFQFSVEDENSPVTHWWPDFFQGYSGIFVRATLDAILASSDVEYVQKNGIVRGLGSQTDGPWNLQAISTRSPVGGTNTGARRYTYLYNEPLGDGVDIYVFDSGVYIENGEFGGRARHGWAAPGLEHGDGHGHGTNVAGIAAGTFYGVAKRASIVAVKVLNEENQGSVEDIIEGINWALGNIRRTGNPSIALLAVGGPFNEALNDAAATLLRSGVTVIAGAGNEGENAEHSSPVSTPGVIVVGAADITNKMWTESNFGEIVDLFAPGVEIRAAAHTGRWDTVPWDGSSQAAAHVAGIAANFLSMSPRMTPALILNQILSLATENAIIDAPEGTTSKFVFNGGGAP